ncbi:MAG: CoA-binding protein [Deltaproteobacteria bacterium]|nr:CoA-binding protein [Deltaproteobacteria bacterium]MBW2685066.1 CoA-binding protein [Deltaproteobacteria bacterium]
MHPLERVINSPEPLVLIGNASEDRFPGYSYDVYTRIGKKFYCLDMGGLPVSRGPTKGGKVYHAVAELPDDRGDLAVIWVHPKTASGAVDLAHEAGCKRVWFSFGTGHPKAVARARELGMDVVEIGRCPVLYLNDKPTAACKVHTLMVKASGLYRRPPQTDPAAKRREQL